MPVSIRVVSTDGGMAAQGAAHKGKTPDMHAADNDRIIAKANLFITVRI
ncbi:hypothetical protein HMPREF0663_11666 [Hoylesella oralis ATCC 33269]|uniref:Uncharacterized protein n=1 Tax=Hoylesella oralis ATCC 33269 TaxID=873533 RepID=E7RR65_9BACT|nr:hypothetical protein HMPREF0663_11666 [Hoylesella oralis ATCC 33269]